MNDERGGRQQVGSGGESGQICIFPVGRLLETRSDRLSNCRALERFRVAGMLMLMMMMMLMMIMMDDTVAALDCCQFGEPTC